MFDLDDMERFIWESWKTRDDPLAGRARVLLGVEYCDEKVRTDRETVVPSRAIGAGTNGDRKLSRIANNYPIGGPTGPGHGRTCDWSMRK